MFSETDCEELAMPDMAALAMLAKEWRRVVEYRARAKQLRAAGELEQAEEYDRLADVTRRLADEREKLINSH